MYIDNYHRYITAITFPPSNRDNEYYQNNAIFLFIDDLRECRLYCNEPDSGDIEVMRSSVTSEYEYNELNKSLHYICEELEKHKNDILHQWM